MILQFAIRVVLGLGMVEYSDLKYIQILSRNSQDIMNNLKFGESVDSYISEIRTQIIEMLGICFIMMIK